MGLNRLAARTGRGILALEPIAGGRFIVPDDRMMDWVADRIAWISKGYRWPAASAIGLVADGEIIAGMVVHDYVPEAGNCQLSFAASRATWATKGSIAAMLAYPFGQLGCRRVTTFIARSNARAIRFNLGLGFKQEGCVRFGFGGEDALVFGLLREEAPAWMGLQ